MHPAGRPCGGRRRSWLSCPLRCAESAAIGKAASCPRAISSVGRAPRLHRGGRRFESVIAHHPASRCTLRRICAIISREAGCPPEPRRRRAYPDALCLSAAKRGGCWPTLYRRYVRPEAATCGAQCRKISAPVQYTPWKLVTYIAFSDERKAETFERYLKSGSGHAFAKKRLW